MSNWREHLCIFCLVSLMLSVSSLIFASSYRLMYPYRPCYCEGCDR